ncbi:hypothetical protein GCM10008927_20860 [Amylibacter ulvae]|uniref:Uncharacterized protein n=1 Tax=Paramylibacter ulvae TaxID=1651968 RepID=A0ABQ3D4Z1_9RHOB|nr:hypothetical protein [Amylibacter ulvae]GHA54867.1 hypothetical protein GCM10008927_20860 [Amylibacter ulvae]
MNFRKIIAPVCVALTCSTSVALAQDPVELTDTHAKYTMQLGGDLVWEVNSDLTGQQSTIVASSPEGHEPFTMVSAMTYLKKNPMAMMGASIKQKTVDGFLEGLCENYKCADISGRTYENIDGTDAWVVSTMLDLSDYKKLGIPDAVMIATSSPEGYMQLFSLHTAEGEAEALKPMLIEAFKTIKATE